MVGKQSVAIGQPFLPLWGPIRVPSGTLGPHIEISGLQPLLNFGPWQHRTTVIFSLGSSIFLEVIWHLSVFRTSMIVESGRYQPWLIPLWLLFWSNPKTDRRTPGQAVAEEKYPDYSHNPDRPRDLHSCDLRGGHFLMAVPEIGRYHCNPSSVPGAGRPWRQ
jgi:hypothetical protein